MGSAFQKERGIVGGNGAIEGFVTAFDLTKAFSSNLKSKFFEKFCNFMNRFCEILSLFMRGLFIGRGTP